jgi:hypothetical protein
VEKRKAVAIVALVGGAALAGLALAFGRPKGVGLVARATNFPQIIGAFGRNGGAVGLGHPTTPAILMAGGRGAIQTYDGGNRGPAAIFVLRGGPAYVVSGGFYELHGGYPEIGWPIEDEHSCENGTKQCQRFTNGEMRWNRYHGQATVKVDGRIVYNSGRPKQRKSGSPWYVTFLKAQKYMYVDIPSIGAGYVLDLVLLAPGAESVITPEQIHASDEFFGIDRKEGIRNPFADDTN